MASVNPDDRDAILGELTGLLAAAYALEAWGRLLVFVERGADGEPRVTDLQVEEIIDDDAVNTAFESDQARGALPALAKAVDTLTLLEGLDLEELGGGTFLRGEPHVSFLAGAVRTPSRSFDARRDAALERITTRNEKLLHDFGIGSDARLESDMLTGALRVYRGAARVADGSQVVLGSFSPTKRSWVWGAFNPTLEEASRLRGATLLDSVRDRSMWEISTPGFVTDAATAWALAALIADEHGLEGIAKVETSSGFVVLGLSKLHPTHSV